MRSDRGKNGAKPEESGEFYEFCAQQFSYSGPSSGNDGVTKTAVNDKGIAFEVANSVSAAASLYLDFLRLNSVQQSPTVAESESSDFSRLVARLFSVFSNASGLISVPTEADRAAGEVFFAAQARYQRAVTACLETLDTGVYSVIAGSSQPRGAAPAAAFRATIEELDRQYDKVVQGDEFARLNGELVNSAVALAAAADAISDLIRTRITGGVVQSRQALQTENQRLLRENARLKRQLAGFEGAT